MISPPSISGRALQDPRQLHVARGMWLLGNMDTNEPEHGKMPVQATGCRLYLLARAAPRLCMKPASVFFAERSPPDVIDAVAPSDFEKMKCKQEGHLGYLGQGQGPQEFGNGSWSVRGMDHELGNERIVVGCDTHACLHPCVHPHLCTSCRQLVIEQVMTNQSDS